MQEPLNVIVLVGSIASGKTTWAQKNYFNYVRLDGDTLKTSAKIIKALKVALSYRCSVVVDATNATLDRRKAILDECQLYAIQTKIMVNVYAVVFKTPLPVCMQRRTKREADKLARGEPFVHIPDVAFYALNKKYVEPTLEEGFSGISVVDFEPTVEKQQPLSSGRRPPIMKH